MRRSVRRPDLRRFLCRCAGTLSLASSTGPAAAGAWTLPEGSGQTIVSGLYAEADRRFDGDGASRPSPHFAKAELTLYGEYGLIDGLTAIVEGRVESVASDGPAEFDEARFGVGALGGRVRLWENAASVVSAEVTARLAPREPDALAVVSMEADGEVRLLAGHGFTLGTVPAFVDAQMAYRFGVPLEPAIKERGDEIRLDATLGVRPRPDWLLMVQSFNVFEEGAAPAVFARRSHKLQFSAVYDLSTSVSLQLGGFATVAGADAVDERGLVSAVWLRF